MSSLSTRALGRTLLARQHLLERTTVAPVAMVEHLVGMQAQVPRDPYLALWSRLEGFAPADLEAALLDRAVAMDGELFDVADGVIIDEDVPAPVRFLPEYDNVLLSHADRRRVTTALPPELYPAGALGIGHVLIDGRVQATWWLQKAKKGVAARVTITHAGLPRRALADVEAAADRALPILSQGAPDEEVRLAAPL